MLFSTVVITILKGSETFWRAFGEFWATTSIFRLDSSMVVVTATECFASLSLAVPLVRRVAIWRRKTGTSSPELVGGSAWCMFLRMVERERMRRSQEPIAGTKRLERMKNKGMLSQGFSYYLVPASVDATVWWGLAGTKLLEGIKNKKMLRQGFSYYLVPASVDATVWWGLAGNKLLENIKNMEMLRQRFS